MWTAYHQHRLVTIPWSYQHTRGWWHWEKNSVMLSSPTQVLSSLDIVVPFSMLLSNAVCLEPLLSMESMQVLYMGKFIDSMEQIQLFPPFVHGVWPNMESFYQNRFWNVISKGDFSLWVKTQKQIQSFVMYSEKKRIAVITVCGRILYH